MSGSGHEGDVEAIRAASRRLVRELGFMRPGLAGTDLPPSAVHALIEIGKAGSTTAASLCDALSLEKSSVSRMIRKLVDAGDIAESPSGSDGRAKMLALTDAGRARLLGIDRFASRQVGGALRRMRPGDRRRLAGVLASYADALHAGQGGAPGGASPSDVAIRQGYRIGLVGRATEMHARTYQRIAGFGQVFESEVAAELAEFAGRLDDPRNGVWTAMRGEAVAGMVAIDGAAPDAARLRWFIVDEGLRGAGIGRRLLTEALGFCRRGGVPSVQLWTFRGLDAARRLYESLGFALAEERPGRRWGGEVTEQRFTLAL